MAFAGRVCPEQKKAGSEFQSLYDDPHVRPGNPIKGSPPPHRESRPTPIGEDSSPEQASICKNALLLPPSLVAYKVVCHKETTCMELKVLHGFSLMSALLFELIFCQPAPIFRSKGVGGPVCAFPQTF